MFRQEISDGWQVELPETCLTHGNPWEFERREASYEIGFGGRVDPSENEDASQHQMRWRPAERVIATPYDTPIAGWRGTRVNTLRPWEAQPIDPIPLDRFNAGDHLGALRSGERSVRKVCVSTRRFRGAPHHNKNKTTKMITSETNNH